MFFKYAQPLILDRLHGLVKELNGVKFFLTLNVTMTRLGENMTPVYTDSFMRCNAQICLPSSDIRDQIIEAYRELNNYVEMYNANGSGWVLERVNFLLINAAQYDPLSGGRCQHEIPPKLLAKKAILNICTEGEDCFLYACLASLHPVKDHANRASNYTQHAREMNVKGIAFPTPLNQIPKFERQNNLSINVFGYENETIFPLKVTENRDVPEERHVNLLMLPQAGEKWHYCAIRSMSRLTSGRSNHRSKNFVCNYCLRPFATRIGFDNHFDLCKQYKPQRVSMPSIDQSVRRFKNYRNSLPAPFTIYLDLEALLIPLEEEEEEEEEEEAKSRTRRVHHHVTSGWAMYIVCSDSELHWFPPEYYRGSDALDKMVLALREAEKKIVGILSNVVPASPTPVQWSAHQLESQCHICGQYMPPDTKTLNHDHLTGAFLGSAHKSCNLGYSYRRKDQTQKNDFEITVWAHNMSKYDAHLIMQIMGRSNELGKLSCLAQTMENYITFSCGRLKFVDTINFMDKSLAGLVEDLKSEELEDDHCFGHLARVFPDESQRRLLLGKMPFPYLYFDCHEKFQETELPPPEAFYNDLSRSAITEADYAKVQDIWRAFDCKNLGQFADIYCLTDCLLLACCFEYFRKMCLKEFGLDSCHYLTLPSLSWDALLRFTGVSVNLLTDAEQYLMFESGIRGGLCQASTRHAKANNPMVEGYDETREREWLMFVDQNNMYGHSLSCYLPEGNFRWLDARELENLDVTRIDDCSNTGYVLEVALDYPEGLHDAHRQFPMAPEPLLIKPDMLSPYAREMRRDLNIKTKSGVKLTLNLGSKEKYIVHYRNLKYYLHHGLILRKIHRAIAFDQSPFMRDFVNHCTELRKSSRTEMKRNLYKKYVNSIYGKSSEQVRRRRNIRLINDKKQFVKAVSKPHFNSFRIFHDQLAAVESAKLTCLLDKPVYIGFTVLELSKLCLYKHHYEYMIPRYSLENVDLIYMDTDSLIYNVKTENIYEDMAEDIERFDTSNYPPEHPLFSTLRAKDINCLKDETAGRPISEIIALRAKLYSYLLADGSEIKKGKGVQRAALKKQLRHSDYRNCLFNSVQTRLNMTYIRNFAHDLYTVKQRKLALSPFDDKVYILRCGVKSRPYFHWRNYEKE